MIGGRVEFVFIVALFCGIAEGKLAPDYIRPCPELTPECLQKTIQNAIPEFTHGLQMLGVNGTDPIYYSHGEIDLPGGFKVFFSDGKVTGLKKCIVESADYKLVEDIAEVNLRCNITFKGKYKAYGKILIVTINGDGDAKIRTVNIKLKTKIKFEDVNVNGTVYRRVKEYSVKHNFGDKVHFVLTNLFKGNQALSEAVLQFLNANWRQVAEEFGQPIVDFFVNSVFGTIKKFFSVIPRNELFV